MPLSAIAPSPPRLPSLDGWRALSIILVLGMHCVFTQGFPPEFRAAFGWLFDGNLGVRIFFCISGFLITHLLLGEHAKTGRIRLREFYLRRALRILPVFFAFLAVVAWLDWRTPLAITPGQWLRHLTFTTGLGSSPQITNHLWSLSAEEQFYVLWPALIVLGGLTRSPKKALTVLAVPLLISPLMRAVGYFEWLPLNWRWIVGRFSPPLYCDSIALGCGLAIIWPTITTRGRRWLCERPFWTVVVGLTLVAVPHVFSQLKLAQVVMAPLGHTLQGLGIILLLAQSILLPKWGLYRLLNLAPVMLLGVLSYSVYLWQQMFWISPKTFGMASVWWMSFPVWLVPPLVLGAASYYALERPLLSLRARYRCGAKPRSLSTQKNASAEKCERNS